MNKYISLLLVFWMQFVFAQKTYTFNLYTSYESKKDNNHFQKITLSDTIKSNYNLSIYAKNDEIINVMMTDYEKGEIYRFKINDKSFKSFEISNNLQNYEVFKMSKRNYKFCKRHYTRNLIKLNDSVNEETFTFYKNRKRKKITSITTIQSLSSKNTKYHFSSEDVGLIIDCIDESYQSKIIQRTNSKYFDGNAIRFEHSNSLVEMQPINFNFIIKK